MSCASRSLGIRGSSSCLDRSPHSILLLRLKQAPLGRNWRFDRITTRIFKFSECNSGLGVEMNPSKTQAMSARVASSDSSKAFNEFFYRSEAEKPSWMSTIASHNTGSGSGEDEENLLDDAYSSYMSRTLSIDSSGTHYSRTGSLESSQDSHYNDHEMETDVVLRVAMCCGKCENKAKSLTQLEGVSSVVCDRKAEKVTVTGTARPRDILEAFRKLFEQAKMWSPDDNLGDLNPPTAPPQ